jgi:hypothetical protein
MRPLATFVAVTALAAIGLQASSPLLLTPVPGSPFGPAGRGVALGDVDGDGDNDVLTTTVGQNLVGQLHVLKNNGKGALTYYGSFGSTFGAQTVVVGHWNSDGKLDAAVPNINGTVGLFFGDGTGAFPTTGAIGLPGRPAPFPGFPPTPAGAVDIATGDFDKDGKADLAVPTFPANLVYVLYGNGTGGFSFMQFSMFGRTFTGRSGPSPTSGIALGDFNNDTILDMAVTAQSPSGVVRLFFGDGGRGFFPSEFSGQFDLGTHALPIDVAAGDVDGDTDLDLVTRSNDGIALLLNNPGAQYVFWGHIGMPGTADLTIADLDGDGRGEILVGVFGGALNILDYNGTALVHATGSPFGGIGGGVAVGQMNNRGGLDVVSGHIVNGHTVLINGPADSTPPEIEESDDVTAEATGPGGAPVTYETPGATDDVDDSVTVTCSPASGSQFDIGTTAVNCSAEDAAGNEATSSFDVTVEDTTDPIVTASGDVSAELTGPAGAAVGFAAATATDAVGVTSGPTCGSASGDTFPLGQTTVICTAGDAAGNSGADSFVVTVVDTTAPELTLPAGITTEQTACVGTPVSIAASASDLSGVATLVDDAPSAYPVGTTIVTFTATDGSGNSSTGTVPVTIADAAAPVISAAAPSQAMLWPPNNKMVPVDVTWTMSDCDASAACRITSVSSNEPGGGDWTIVDGNTVQLRAKRLGGGSGRVYTITVECRDGAGNASQRSVTVTVPHNQ